MVAATRTETRRRLPAAERRAVVVEAAGRLFGERGYDAVTLDQVAAAAGVTKPILYRHFGSKRELYLALLERHRDDLSGFTAPLEAGGEPDDVLRAILGAWLDYVEERSYAWRMLFRDRGGSAEVETVRRETSERAREVMAGIVRGVTAGTVPEPEVEPLAELLRGGMATLVLWWLDHPEVEREALVDAMARLWQGLVPEPA